MYDVLTSSLDILKKGRIPESAADIFPAYLLSLSLLLVAALLVDGPAAALLRQMYRPLQPPGQFPVAVLLKVGNNLNYALTLVVLMGTNNSRTFCVLCLAPFAVLTYAFYRAGDGYIHRALLLLLLAFVAVENSLQSTVAAVEALKWLVTTSPISHPAVGLFQTQMLRDLLLGVAIMFPNSRFARFLMPGMKDCGFPQSMFVGALMLINVATSATVLSAGLSASKISEICCVALPCTFLMFLGALQGADFGTKVYVGLPLVVHGYTVFVLATKVIHPEHVGNKIFSALTLALLSYYALLKNMLPSRAAPSKTR